MGKLIDYLQQSVTKAPAAIAIGGDAAPVTYAGLMADVNALASAMQQLDPAPASRIGICARNNRQHFMAVLATYAAGKVWVPLNPRNGQAELESMIAATRPALFIVDDEFVDRFALVNAPLVLCSTGMREEESGKRAHPPSVDQLIESNRGLQPALIDRGIEAPQIIKFSGGSTGAPKPVVQSIRCVDAQARAILECFEFTSADVNLVAAPLTHGASCFVLPILAAGGRHVLLEHPGGAAILDAIARHGVTTVYAPPTLIYAMMDEHRERPRSIASLRHLIYSAAPMPPARIREVQHVFGPVLETAYGLVEAPQIITAMRAGELAREENIASVGRPSSVVTVTIVNPDGERLPAGEMGEIAVQGPLLMNGYLDRPQQTSETIINGWLRTGDLGVLDERGYLFIKGRLREVINTGGFKVLPADVESVLSRHAAVAECCVFGAEDEKWGEAVHAAVRLAEGSHASAAELIAFVKHELDSVKAPKHVHFVSELPRNAAGKVSRQSVRAMIASPGGISR